MRIIRMPPSDPSGEEAHQGLSSEFRGIIPHQAEWLLSLVCQKPLLPCKLSPHLLPPSLCLQDPSSPSQDHVWGVWSLGWWKEEAWTPYL